MSKTSMSTKLKAKGADPATVINRAAELAKDKTTLSFPDGDFNLLSPIEIMNKGIRIEGAEKTNFKVYHKGPGFVFNRNASTSRTHINRISIMNHLNEDNGPDQHGIMLHVPTTMEDVTIENFHGTGLHITGDTSTRKGTDVSFCRISSVYVRSCKGDGVYVAGGDSNGIILSHVGVWDNGGVGIHDESFLGIKLDACMAHNSKKGHYRVSMPTSHTTVDSCYGEGDSPPSFFSGYTVVLGGIHENGYILDQDATFIKGRQFKSFRSGAIDIDETNGMTFGKPGVTYGLNMNLIEKSGAFPHYGMHHKEGDFWQVFAANKEYPAQYNNRSVPFASSGFQHLFIGDRLFITGEKDQVIKQANGFEFKSGDTIFNSKFDGTNAERWVFVGKDWKEIKI